MQNQMGPIDKTIRLSRVIRECNIGIDSIVDFLVINGYCVERNPNSKINTEVYEFLQSTFPPYSHYKAVINSSKADKLVALKMKLEEFRNRLAVGPYEIEMAILETVGVIDTLDEETLDIIGSFLLNVKNLNVWKLIVRLNSIALIERYVTLNILPLSDELKLNYLNASYHDCLLSKIMFAWSTKDKKTNYDLCVFLRKNIKKMVHITEHVSQELSSIEWEANEIWDVYSVCKNETISKNALSLFSFLRPTAVEWLRIMASDNFLNQENFNVLINKYVREANYISDDKYLEILGVICKEYETDVAYEIIDFKITNIVAVNKDELKCVLKSIHMMPDPESAAILWSHLVDKLLEILSKRGFEHSDNSSIEDFNQFIRIIKHEEKNINYEDAVLKLNKIISEEFKFELWRTTGYFVPDSIFFETHIKKLNYCEFLKTKSEFHYNYFKNGVRGINNFIDIENFGMLTLFVVEVPLKVMNEIWQIIPVQYQLAYWLNFPKWNIDYLSYFNSQMDDIDSPFKIGAYCS
ncbi:MAG: hypothetical protein IPP38_09965 [Bacteroidetes bacterium]|nr:hypothetical protein [Bacteroidota bacterium]